MTSEPTTRVGVLKAAGGATAGVYVGGSKDLDHANPTGSMPGSDRIWLAIFE